MSPSMSRPDQHALPIVPPCAAEVRVEEIPEELRIVLGGVWRVTNEKPDWFPSRTTA